MQRAAKWNTHHNLHFFLWDIRTTDVIFRVDISSPGQILTFLQPIQCLPNLCKPFEFVRVGQQANYTPLAENASFKELAKYSALLLWPYALHPVGHAIKQICCLIVKRHLRQTDRLGQVIAGRFGSKLPQSNFS